MHLCDICGPSCGLQEDMVAALLEAGQSSASGGTGGADAAQMPEDELRSLAKDMLTEVGVDVASGEGVNFERFSAIMSESAALPYRKDSLDRESKGSAEDASPRRSLSIAPSRSVEAARLVSPSAQ